MAKKYKLSGTLNHESLCQLDDNDIKTFLITNTNKVFPRFIEEDLVNEISKGRVSNYKVTAYYNILDCKYNPHGELTASLSYNRTDGTQLIDYNIKTN